MLLKIAATNNGKIEQSETKLGQLIILLQPWKLEHIWSIFWGSLQIIN